MQLSYPRIYDTGNERFIGFPKDTLQINKCPICRAMNAEHTTREDSHDPSKPHYVRYGCRGMYFLTVDLNGVPCWEGRCGQKLSQLVLAFPEEA
jgi:uncharacterized protein with WD repeat